MTEQEWLECKDPQKMLEFLCHNVAAYELISRYPRAYDRKHRLFGCFCCRRFWPLLRSKTSQRAVDVAERMAEGRVTEDERRRTYKNAQTGKSFWRIVRLEQEARTNSNDDSSDLLVAAFRAAGALVDQYSPVGQLASQIAIRAATTQDDERALHCAWLRDLFGILAFRLVAVSTDWLTWNDGTVKKIAQGNYDDRAFDRMPILADALEEAGCTNLDILTHCRQPGEHVRGCWVVDLCLGK